MTARDAIVVGSGPNGLAAAIALARQGRAVTVLEAAETPGGGLRSEALTLPGFVHDVCSSVHALVLASPFLSELDLPAHGLDMIHPTYPYAHPFSDGTAAVLHRSVEETARGLGRDAAAYRLLMAPLVDAASAIVDEILGPFRIPRSPIVMTRFAMRARRSARGLATATFATERAAAFFCGAAAHSTLPLTRFPTAGFGLGLTLVAHAYGWPVARGGSNNVAGALIAEAERHGVVIEAGRTVRSTADLPSARAYLFDVSPRALARIAGDDLPGWYRRVLERFRYGPGVFKVDWALDGPIPWRAPECAGASTVHVIGELADLLASENDANSGRVSERPYVLLVQQTPFDVSRAPDGKHTAWGYCHVPNGSTVDMTARIERQVERFAPGFRDLILARHARNARELEAYNANYVGGDINVGFQDARQLFTRPPGWWPPYATPNPRIYLCSSATPPGGGVHGMCGFHAARCALRRVLS